MQTVLIAGASGALGRATLAAARRAGFRTRALVRRPLTPSELGADEVVVADALRGAGLDEACRGVVRVFSSLGASVSPDFGRGYSSFERVDTPANLALLEAASRAGARRFVYVSVACHEQLGHLAYVRAHERVVAELRSSGLSYAVLRPTGFFSAFESLLELARRGPLPMFGSPEARTNPIADDDLAALAASALASDETFERSAGGPIVYTRREISELAFAALKLEPRFRKLPTGLVRALGASLWPFNPRVSDLTAFYLAVASRDCLGEVTGTERLDEYFANCVRSW